MKFLDLFSGIGGFRLGMEMAGHECIGYVEIDKFARKSYQAIHDTEGEWTACDITTVSDDAIRGIGHTDIICGGFPCQAFSIAGKRAGFNDTRGTLFFEIMRFTSILKPKYLFLENVKGLLNHESGDTFETIIRTMDELGYGVEWQVLNSKDFGVPQNRERVFIIGHSRTERTRKVFPIGASISETDIKIVGSTAPPYRTIGQRDEVYSAEGLMGCLNATDYKQPKQIIVKGELDIKGQDVIKRVYGTEGISPSLTTMQGGNREPKIIQRPRGNNKGGFHSIAPTLTSNSYQDNNHLNDGYRIRKLTPRECWRLQGFPDWAFDKAAEVNSDSQLYKQAGNSVTVNVIYEIAKGLKDERIQHQNKPEQIR